MAQNDFKAFSTGNGANVIAQADWENLRALVSGFQSGKAASAQVNKALRQGTSMAAVLGQYIADYSGEDALDDGDTDRLLANLPLAIRASLRLNNLNYFVDGGAANQLVITPQPAITTLVDGQSFDIACAAANTGAVTLQVNDLPAYPLLGSAGALQGGEIGAAKGVIRVIWSASKTSFLLVAQNSSGPLAVAPAVNTNQAAQLGQVLQIVQGSALPVGTPVPWPSATPPVGYLKCNGAAFDGAIYPQLALVYPTLVLPDLRGEFIRGWDDGRGVDSGRGLLSLQSDALQDHTHNVDGLRRTTDKDRGDNSSLWSIDNVETATTTGASGNVASETRPRNIAFNFILRAA